MFSKLICVSFLWILAMLSLDIAIATHVGMAKVSGTGQDEDKTDNIPLLLFKVICEP